MPLATLVIGPLTGIAAPSVALGLLLAAQVVPSLPPSVLGLSPALWTVPLDEVTLRTTVDSLRTGAPIIAPPSDRKLILGPDTRGATIAGRAVGGTGDTAA